MKKPSKRDTINLFFSAFLIIAFLVCVYFFSEFTKTLSGTIGTTITVALCAVFGLLLFYATRVGEGMPIKRFSPITLILLVLPTLYVILATVLTNMPLHEFFITESGDASAIALLSSVVFGYAIPYSFFSGFELEYDETELEDEDDEDATQEVESEDGAELDVNEANADSDASDESVVAEENAETAQNEVTTEQ